MRWSAHPKKKFEKRRYPDAISKNCSEFQSSIVKPDEFPSRRRPRHGSGKRTALTHDGYGTRAFSTEGKTGGKDCQPGNLGVALPVARRPIPQRDAKFSLISCGQPGFGARGQFNMGIRSAWKARNTEAECEQAGKREGLSERIVESRQYGSLAACSRSPLPK